MSSFDSVKTPSKQIWSSPSTITTSNNNNNDSNNSTPSTSNSNRIYRSNSISTISDPWNTTPRSTNITNLTKGTTSSSIENNNNNNNDDEEELESFISSSNKNETWELPIQETLEVTRNEQPSGSFLLKYLVYTIHTPKTSTIVKRRYNDFIWLSECLLKRYPFRLLPSLPPKQLNFGVVAVNYVIQSDELFLERRRKGLKRFLEFILNHPVLKFDHLVRTFLTEPSDLSIWRKTASYTLSEESSSRILTSSEESSLPKSFDSQLNSITLKINNLVETWTELSRIFERLAHRLGNQGRDFLKFENGLKDCLAVEREVEGRNGEMENGGRKVEIVAEFCGKAGAIDVVASGRSIDGTVEELKRHRELYINFRDLLTRQIRLSPDGIDKLRKRTEINIQKLETLRQQSQTTTSSKSNYESELENLTTLIESDQKTSEMLLRRRIFIRWSIYQEFLYLQRSTSLLSLALKDFANDQLNYSELSRFNWSALVDAL